MNGLRNLRRCVAGQRRRGTLKVSLHRPQSILSGGVGGLGRQLARSHRRHQDDFLGDGVEDRHDARPCHHAVGQVERVGIDVGQPLDQPDHVVADRAEQTGGRRRQPRRHLDAGCGHQVAQAVEGAAGLGREAACCDIVAFRHLGPIAPATPDQVRVECDDRVARTERTALDALEQERVGAPVADFQIGRDRRLQVVDQAGPDELGTASPVRLLEGRIRRLDGHFASGALPDVAFEPAALGSIGSRPIASRAWMVSSVTLISRRAAAWAVSPISRM